MAPDRGASRSPDYQSISTPPSNLQQVENDGTEELQRRRSEARQFIASHASEGQNFTIRGISVGLGVGLVICFSNMYFGLQTGWVSGMSMPSSLIGFAFFKTLSKHLDLPFTPVENVLVQTVAGSMGTMPLGCGFVGVMPALNYMLTPEEQGPLFLSLWKLSLWALGLCFFGVVFAVPLRKQVIIREKLKFPSGTATALMISVLHGKETITDTSSSIARTTSREEAESTGAYTELGANAHADVESRDMKRASNWKANVKLLVISFVISGLYTLATYFFPILRNLPIFGTVLANSWLWTLNPSLAYVGQGIIMGPATTTHMLIGAVVGWGLLSPLAKQRGWAPGPVDDWEQGSKGWIVWISLAIMLADSVISLGYIAILPVYTHGSGCIRDAHHKIQRRDWQGLLHLSSREDQKGYTQIIGREDLLTPLEETGPISQGSDLTDTDLKDLPEPDAPKEHLVNDKTVWIGMVLSVIFCVATIRIVFGTLVPLYATVMAVLMALILSIMGVRASIYCFACANRRCKYERLRFLL